MRRLIRKWHKWPSLVLTVFILVFALSGIVLNHRSWFSGVDIPRKYLPQEYRYANWNNAAVRGSCSLSGDSLLVYGNIGIWLTGQSFTDFQDFNAGFTVGIDNRKINKVFRTESGSLYAGTLFGLYRFDHRAGKWVYIEIPGREEQVVDITGAAGEVYVMTRSHLLKMSESGPEVSFQTIDLPAPDGYDGRASLFKTLWVIHSGEIGGFAGKLVVDLMGILFIFLSITGIIYWLFPKWIRRRKKVSAGIGRLKSINRFSLRWHIRAGVYALLFLVVTVITGMFLRPPLLIAIATERVSKIPFTLLDDPNPWYDQLRRILYDEEREAFIIGTNRGIYYSDTGFDRPLIPFSEQPPQSIMGLNVFEKTADGNYFIGSFNGLFLWNPYQGWMIDYFSPGSAVIVNPSGPPISDHMAAGYVSSEEGDAYVFDFNKGLSSLKGLNRFPPMPAEVLENSPMSLWNLALELHTGRYYSFLFGKLYILFIPLFGLSMLLILLTGLWLWWKRRRDGS